MREGLALLRLGLLFALFWVCILLLQLSLLENWPGGRLVGNDAASTQAAAEIPFLGVTVELEQYASEQRRAELARLRDAGFGWVRQRLDWGELEPQPGQFQWQLSDAILHDIVNSGLVPVVVLDGSPAWARAPVDTGAQDQPLAPPADPGDFAAFAQQFATRYGSIVRYYQVWDEPNIAPHWGNRHIEPVAYARLLRAGGRAIRDADADAVILLAALAPTLDRGHTAIDEVHFLQRLYAAQRPGNAPPLFDVVTIQPFGFHYTPTDTQRDVLNFQRARLVRRVMVAAGDASTPIWIVRYGWNRFPGSPWSTVTPEIQADFAIQALDIARHEWPWLVAVGWAVDRPAAPRSDPSWGFALDDRLRDRFASWQPIAVNRQPDPVTRAAVQMRDWWWIGMLMLGLVVSAWRGWAAARVLPWRPWLDRLQRAPISLRLLSWLLLLVIYYLATWPPLIALCLVAAILLNLAHPLDGICLAALVLPFHFQHKELHLLSTQITLAPAQAAALTLVPALIAQRSQESWRDGWSVLAVLWLALNLMGVFSAWRWSALIRGVAEMALFPLLLFAAARLFIQTDEQLRRVCAALFAGGGLVALVGLVRWLGGDGTSADGVLRLVGPHFSPNHTALYLERTLFLGIGFVFAVRPPARWGWLAACALVLAALILTASRGALLLGIPTGLLLTWLLHRLGGRGDERGRTPSPWRWLLVAVLALGIGLLVLGIFQERLLNSATLLRRLLIWRATWQLWLDHVWLGVGAEGFFWRYPAYILEMPHLDPNLRHPHNAWLESAAIWGVGGLLWLAAFLALIGRDLYRTRRSLHLPWPHVGLLIGLLTGFAHAQVDAFMTLADLASWNWLAVGLWSCYAMRPFQRNNSPQRAEH